MRLMSSGMLFVCMVLQLAAGAAPEGQGDSVLALETVIETALRDNAELGRVRAEWEAAQERPGQARSLPNPMLTYGAMGPQEDYSFPDSEERRIGLEQTFPWIGKRALRGRIAEQDASAMQHDYQAMCREVVMTAKENYYDLYALEQVIDIIEGEKDLLKQMEETAQTRYTIGSVEQQDVIKVQAEGTMLQQRLIELEQQRNVMRAKLNQLLNRSSDSFLGRPHTAPPGKAAPKLEDLIEEAKQARPEIAAARIRLEQAGLGRRLMAKEYFPDLTLGVESRSFREEDDMVMAMIAIDLPLWLGRNRAGVREAEKSAVARRTGLEAALRQADYDVQDAYYKLVAAQRTLELHRTALLPQAEARFSASEAGYRAGKSDFLDLLESERFLLEVRVMAAMSEGSVGVQWARLDRAVGAEYGEEVRNQKSRGDDDD